MLKYAAAAPVVLSLSTLAAPIAAASAIAGMTVFLDPGHNGANDASINRQVTNGRGGTKECQTTGTTTDSGYPEHSFNWDVVLRIRATLTQYGVRTAMSRGNDNAIGPCVDQRAAMANAIHPDAICQHSRRRRAAGRARVSRQLLQPAAQRRPGRSCRAFRSDHA